MATATVLFTGFSLALLWWRARAMDIAGWDFAKLAIVISVVWIAIGAVMTFYIVMIVRKNEKRD